MVKISPSEITPEQVFLNRRQFMAASGALAGALAISACAPGLGGESASDALLPPVTEALGPDNCRQGWPTPNRPPAAARTSWEIP